MRIKGWFCWEPEGTQRFSTKMHAKSENSEGYFGNFTERPQHGSTRGTNVAFAQGPAGQTSLKIKKIKTPKKHLLTFSRAFQRSRGWRSREGERPKPHRNSSGTARKTHDIPKTPLGGQLLPQVGAGTWKFLSGFLLRGQTEEFYLGWMFLLNPTFPTEEYSVNIPFPAHWHFQKGGGATPKLPTDP